MKRASRTVQDDPDLEGKIRERAYHLWVEAGHHHGRAEEFWYQAEQDIRGGAARAGAESAAGASNPVGSAVEEAVEDYTGRESGTMDPATEASLASDEGVAPAESEVATKPRRAPAKAKSADKGPGKPNGKAAPSDSVAEKPRRTRRPGATT